MAATEVSMNRYPPGRRDFLKGITALGTACLPYAARVESGRTEHEAGIRSVGDIRARGD